MYTWSINWVTNSNPVYSHTHTRDNTEMCIWKYCYVSGVPWLVITGSGSDDWIYWRLLLQSLLITINYNSSQSVTKTRSIPYWTMSIFCSSVTDLLLIYESITSSASAVRWLTLHCWTLSSTLLLNWAIQLPSEFSYYWIRIHYLSPLHNFGMHRVEINISNSSPVILFSFVAAETCVNFVTTLSFPQAYPLLRIHA
jgi:hypothetical protein